LGEGYLEWISAKLRIMASLPLLAQLGLGNFPSCRSPNLALIAPDPFPERFLGEIQLAIDLQVGDVAEVS
jgi:hypothetical protein